LGSSNLTEGVEAIADDANYVLGLYLNLEDW
jgi:hypothetical protein